MTKFGASHLRSTIKGRKGSQLKLERLVITSITATGKLSLLFVPLRIKLNFQCNGMLSTLSKDACYPGLMDTLNVNRERLKKILPYCISAGTHC